MKAESWIRLALEECSKLKKLETQSLEMTNKVIETIKSIGQNCSRQWLRTHQVASNQVETGLKTYSKMFSSKVNVRFYNNKILTSDEYNLFEI